MDYVWVAVRDKPLCRTGVRNIDPIVWKYHSTLSTEPEHILAPLRASTGVNRTEIRTKTYRSQTKPSLTLFVDALVMPHSANAAHMIVRLIAGK